MSASVTKWSPPPAHNPFTAQITGFVTPLCQAVSRSAASRVRRDCSRNASRSFASWTTSKPVWNSRPLPVLMITRTCGSESSSCHAASSSSSIVASMALPESGRLKISQPMWSCRSTTRVVNIASAPRNFSPRRAAPRIGFARKAENAFTHDVLIHFCGSALDRVCSTPEHPLDLSG